MVMGFHEKVEQTVLPERNRKQDYLPTELKVTSFNQDTNLQSTIIKSELNKNPILGNTLPVLQK